MYDDDESKFIVFSHGTYFDRKARKRRSFHSALAAPAFTLGFCLLALFAFVMGTASPALGAEKFCSDPPYYGVIDGDLYPVPTQITIDQDCTFQNFPQSNPLTTTINFQTNDPSIYLIIFDNVYYTGNMACSNIDHRIWFSNGSYYGSGNTCQDLFIPVESIKKENPTPATAAIGVPFTYTLTLPALQITGEPSLNDLHTIILWDDLTATGADLTFVSIEAHYKGDISNTVTLVPETDPAARGGIWTPKNLSYEPIPLIYAGEQIEVNITVVLDNSVNNIPGTTFVNTAKWWFGRLIDDQFYEPLPGEWGVTPPMTIVKPNLVVNKTGPTSVVNLGQIATFTLDVLNNGTGDAWNVVVADQLAGSSSTAFIGGMCNLPPAVTSVTLAGTLLTENVDYTTSYSGCDLTITLLDAAGPIGPNEHLIITYEAKADLNSESGALLTNVAGAAQWTNHVDENVGQTFTCTLSDGTVGTLDCQDAHDVLIALSGFFYEKTVADPVSSTPVTTALPGATLRYTLRFWSISEPYPSLQLYDDLNTASAFVPGSLSIVNAPAGAVVANPASGILDVSSVSVPAGGVAEVTFDVTLDSALVEGFIVQNQASVINSSGVFGLSDDPTVNGPADPYVPGDEDPTRVLILFPPPPPPAKVINSPVPAEATIGEEVVYEIRIPETVATRPLFDVEITDTLNVNLEYLSFTQTGGPAVTDNSVAPDLSYSVAQIPTGEQVVIEVHARVRNILGVQQGVTVNNTVSYTYANISGGTVQTALSSGTVVLTIVEPHIFDITKTVNSATPAPGDTIRYSVTLSAADTTFSAEVFDVTLADTLDLGLVYVGNPSVTAGSGVGSDNTIGAPVITGDGINQAQTLRWSLNDGNADIDIAEGETVTISYDVQVLYSAPALTNYAIAEWTSLDGLDSYERDGSDGIGGLNDYVTVPATTTVSNLPLLYALKTVQISGDGGTPGIVDPGDVLLYTIVLSNSGGIPATSVVLTDAVPSNTTYNAGSFYLNGVLVPDGGVLPLIAGLQVQSSDNPGAGIVSPGESATITFEVTVVGTVLPGDIISNQGSVASVELPLVATDSDGDSTNGYQPTVIVVGDVQLLSISKQVSVVGGGTAQPGGQLEYVIQVTNIGTLPGLQVIITDDLNPPLGSLVTYVSGTGTMNGSSAGISYAGGVLTADYDSQYGDLLPGETVVMRFRVQINSTLAAGTTITNTGVVSWNNATQSDSASVSLDVGGAPGSASLNGIVCHDANLDKVCDSSTETVLAGWTVELYRNGVLLYAVLTDSNGIYRINGLLPNAGTSDLYELRFIAAGAGPNTASLGYADSLFTNGPQQISDIIVSSGDNLQNLNLPLWPNGAVYSSISRTPVAGARVTMLNAATGTPLSPLCFDDPVQQDQITAADGFYKFDLNFNDGSCLPGDDYLIEVTPVSGLYVASPSKIISPASDATTAPFPVLSCPGNPGIDAVPATTQYCEIVASPVVPPTSVPANTVGTTYYLHLTLSDGAIPGQSQAFNNFIPLDPILSGAVAITKTSPLTDVTRGSLVPYTITVTNVYGVSLNDISIVDHMPAGFKYKADSAQLNGKSIEPKANGLKLVWDNLDLQVNQTYTIRLLLVVGSGVSEGKYVNRATVINSAGGAVSGEATATVRVVPDPDFDCTDVIGKVFDDRNLNGVQDSGENGLFGIKVVTARGLIVTTDEYGRFHISCAVVPDEDRGSNFILKLDERSLPSGYRLTTENPRVQRATRGKMIRFNFGATIHRVVRIDIADGAFEPGSTEIRVQWRHKIDELIAELMKAPSVLRLSYLGDVEPKGLVKERLKALKEKISKRWEQSEAGYRLTIETEIYWRRGSPIAGWR